MSHVAIVKTVHEDKEVGRWTFGTGDDPESIEVEKTEGLNEFDQEMLDGGLVKNLRDFQHLVVGSRGTRYFDWEDDDAPQYGTPNLSQTIEELRKRGPDKPDEGKVEKDAEVELSADGEIAKTDKAQQIVFGWAYVTHDAQGRVNVDKSGDFIDAVEEIEKSAYDYVLSSRKGDADHTNVQSGRLVESIVFTPDKIEKMGLPAGSIPLGWWLGYKVDDPEVWKRVEKGELRAFSIHGKGTRKSVD